MRDDVTRSGTRGGLPEIRSLVPRASQARTRWWEAARRNLFAGWNEKSTMLESGVSQGRQDSKKAGSMTPMQRSRDNLTARGYLVGSVERKKRFPDRKKHQCKVCGNVPMIEISADLFGAFDLIALRPWGGERGTREDRVLVQVTSRNNHSTRRNKILGSMEAKLCLLSGMDILIQSWRQDEKSKRWQAFDEWITIEDYKQAVSYPNTVAELNEIKRKAKLPDFPRHSNENFDELPF
jgi:hypothetical protein